MVVQSGAGTLLLHGNATAFSGTETIKKGTLELASGGAAGSGTIHFASSGTTLRIDGTVMPTNKITGFTVGETINLAGIAFSSGETATFSGTTLTVSSGGSVVAQLTLTGVPSSASFIVSSDTLNGGIDITDPVSITVSSGHTSTGLTLNSGDVMTVLASGTASATTVNSGGLILDHGITISSIVNSGGVERVSSSGAGKLSVLTGQVVLSSGHVRGTAVQAISAGGSALDTVLSSGGEEDVSSGAIAFFTEAHSGGFELVSLGGITSFVTLDGGSEAVLGGIAIHTLVNSSAAGSGILPPGALYLISGATIGTLVSSGGVQVVSGGVASSTILMLGGAELVVSAGLASHTTVSNGAAEFLESGGVASGAIIVGSALSAAAQVLLAGGTAIGTHVSTGGVQIVSSGGVASGATLIGQNLGILFAEQTVLAGGIARNTHIGSAGVQNVSSGGVVSGAVLSSHGAQFVSAHGIASATVVSSGGAELVSSGGIARATRVLFSGGQLLSGIAIGTRLSSGGGQFVYSRGLASGSVVNSSGGVVVFAGGVLRNSLVNPGGVVIDSGFVTFTTAGTTTFAGILSGAGTMTEVGSSGTLVMRGDAGAFSGTEIISRGTLELTSAGAAGSGTIHFAGSGTTLRIDGTVMPTNKITGFTVGETINLAGIPFSSGETATYSGTTLTVSSGGSVVAKLTLTGVPSSASFHVTADAVSGIDITDPPAPSMATPHGADTVPAGMGCIGNLPQFASSESVDAASGNSSLQGGMLCPLPSALADVHAIGVAPELPLAAGAGFGLPLVWPDIPLGTAELHGGNALHADTIVPAPTVGV